MSVPPGDPQPPWYHVNSNAAPTDIKEPRAPRDRGFLPAARRADADQARVIGDPGEEDIGMREPRARRGERVTVAAPVAGISLPGGQPALEAPLEDGRANAAGLLLVRLRPSGARDRPSRLRAQAARFTADAPRASAARLTSCGATQRSAPNRPAPATTACVAVTLIFASASFCTTSASAPG